MRVMILLLFAFNLWSQSNSCDPKLLQKNQPLLQFMKSLADPSSIGSVPQLDSIRCGLKFRVFTFKEVNEFLLTHTILISEKEYSLTLEEAIILAIQKRQLCRSNSYTYFPIQGKEMLGCRRIEKGNIDFYLRDGESLRAAGNITSGVRLVALRK